MRFLVKIGLALTIALTFPGREPAFGQGITAQQVQNSIDACISYLKQRQSKSGKWPGNEMYGSGQSSLVLLALLNAGVPLDAPVVQSGLKYLRSVTPKKTYEVALQTMVYCAAEPNRDIAEIQRNVQWLVKVQKMPASGGNVGSWGYDETLGGGDPSNSQFALLALWEAQRIGVDIPRDTLELAFTNWSLTQSKTGGWNYSPLIDQDLRGSMTCAGIASLLIAEDALRNTGDARIVKGEVQCCLGNPQVTPVDLGVNWLIRNFSVKVNPPIAYSPGFFYYYLYALERTARLTGLRHFGPHDWYREGCELLVSRQDVVQGFFPPGAGDEVVSATAFGLLFLAKGKRQVVIGRLDYRTPQNAEVDWALHRHGIQNLTGHIERFWKRDLSWQTVQLAQSKVEDLLECPVLFLSGRGKLQFDARSKAMLKAYVEQGGFLFAEACNGDGCDGAAFEKSFRELMQELFEEPMEKLSLAHPVWTAESRVDPEFLPSGFWLYGIEKCCRTSVIFSPISLSCRWELSRPYGKQMPLEDRLQGELDNAVKIGANVVAYATGRELKEKLEPVEMVTNSRIDVALGRGTITLPKILHGGGADEVRLAITNLLEVLHRETNLEVASKSLLVSPTDPQLQEHPLLYLHGRQSFTFSESERAALRNHLENGGFILGDAICASKPFADSVQAELQAILPDASWVPVPVEHPALTTQFGGFDIRRVTITEPSQEAIGGEKGKGVGIRKQVGPPVLQMLVHQERVVAIFSPLDMSCALESRGASQCLGYLNKDAAKIGINMILFALLQ